MDLSDVQKSAGLTSPIQSQLFIDGKFVDALSGETLPTLNPHDNSVIAHVAMAGKADVDAAVAAAQRAFPAWSRMAAADRGIILLRLAELIEANAEELARLESLDTGHPLKDSRFLDVPRTAACYRYFGGMADKFQGETIPVEAGFLNYTLREPVGVVGQVVPWNFPLMFTGTGCRQLRGDEASRNHATVFAENCRTDGPSRHAARCGERDSGPGPCGRPIHR